MYSGRMAGVRLQDKYCSQKKRIYIYNLYYEWSNCSLNVTNTIQRLTGHISYNCWSLLPHRTQMKAALRLDLACDIIPWPSYVTNKQKPHLTWAVYWRVIATTQNWAQLEWRHEYRQQLYETYWWKEWYKEVQKPTDRSRDSSSPSEVFSVTLQNSHDEVSMSRLYTNNLQSLQVCLDCSYLDTF
jgi:hypothetical protein